MGVNVTSPAPRYAAQDHIHLPAEKQAVFVSSVASVVEEDERSDLRSSPVQEQDPSLPFHHDDDVDVAKMRRAQSHDHLNMEDKIPHLFAIDTKEYERYQRAYC